MPMEEVYYKADELKIIIHDESDFQWAEENAKLIDDDCVMFLQPEWSRREQMIPRIVKYILSHPYWTISLQSHKYMNIP